MKRKYNKGRMEQRFANVSDEEMRERWIAMRPKAFRAVCISATLTVLSYLTLHFNFPVRTHGQGVAPLSLEYFTILAFQISSVLDICLGMLVGMTYLYGRTPVKK